MLSNCKDNFAVLQQWWWANRETGKHFWQLSTHVNSTERKQVSNSASNSLWVWHEDSEGPFSFLYFNSCCWDGTLHCGCQLWCLYVIHSSPRGSSQGGCIQMGLPSNPSYSAGCHLLWSDKDLKRWRGKAVWVHPRRWRCKSFSLFKLSLKGKCRWSCTMKQMFGSWCQMNAVPFKVSFIPWPSPKVHVAVNCFENLFCFSELEKFLVLAKSQNNRWLICQASANPKVVGMTPVHVLLKNLPVVRIRVFCNKTKSVSSTHL